MSKLKPYQKRMRDELAELNRRICKLEQFVEAYNVGHTVFANYQPGLSEAQLHAMKAYSAILEERTRIDDARTRQADKPAFPTEPGLYKDQHNALWTHLPPGCWWKKITANDGTPIDGGILHASSDLEEAGYVFTPAKVVDK
jgi:hypothetical protein